jgi:gentisate 1,2-dioxygenase
MTSILERINTLDDLDAELARSHMSGQWKDEKQLEKAAGGPNPSSTPFVWHWSTIQAALLAACKILTDGKTARRSLGLTNPSLARRGTTHTIYAAVQMVRPGEIAWAHRHSISALRFGIEGEEGLYTVVDGERLRMDPGDLILTPSFCWHDHHNDSRRDGLWLDVLDLPLVIGLGQTAYAAFGEQVQPVREDTDAGGAPARRPSVRYPWNVVERELARNADCDGSPTDAVMLEYLDPVTGNAALPTLGCKIQMLRPGLTTRRHRKTSSAICYVIEGSGTTTFDDQEIRWGERDVFAIPEWTWHRHVNHSKDRRAVLFVVDDVPLLKKIGLYREE